MSNAKNNTDKLRGLGPNGTVTSGNINSEAASIGQILTANGAGGATFEDPAVLVTVSSVNSQTGDVVLTKSDIGLGNADNTSDANKPVSTAAQTALDLKSNTSHVHEGTTIKSTAEGASKVLTSNGSGGALWQSATLFAYGSLSDGTNTAVASLPNTTLNFRSADNKLTTTVGNDDPTYGDNLLLTVNEANLTLQNLGGTLTVAKGGTGSGTAGGALTNLGAASLAANTFTGTQTLGNNNLAAVKAVYFNSEIDDGNSSTADTINWSAGSAHKSTLTGNVTYTFTAPSGVGYLQLKVVQDATGGRTVTWPTITWTHSSGTAPVIKSAANAVTLIHLYYDGTNYFGTGSAESGSAASGITAGTPVSASGTSVDFTGIPSTAQRITILFSGVSLTASSLLIQIGDSGGFETTGYVSSGGLYTNSNTTVVSSSTAGFVIPFNAAADVFSGSMVLIKTSGNLWTSSHSGKTATTQVNSGGGDKTLSDTLTQVRITSANGSATFDAGTLNILYE